MFFIFYLPIFGPQGLGNNFRLGTGNTNSATYPVLLNSLLHVRVTKVAVHSGGQHCLVLTSDGLVFSWGEGADGRLGHGDTNCRELPEQVVSLPRGIVDVVAGGAHSAAITESVSILELIAPLHPISIHVV
ncbi:unnamed protein product [Protopolystoma xenopodis]|uniref:Uncharacterized protein n=1 Tax=Protopolystoma xenopodis TaxID=117903 RepID=A0A3S5FFJ8_9PLAT|nr:unnamed protein product [Protopolystoma xenopodis]